MTVFDHYKKSICSHCGQPAETEMKQFQWEMCHMTVGIIVLYLCDEGIFRDQEKYRKVGSEMCECKGITCTFVLKHSK